MVSVNNVNFSGDNCENTKSQRVNEEEKSLVSIFNTDGDDVFSVEEQKSAYNNELDNLYNQFKVLFDKAGFKLQDFKEKIFKNLENLDLKDDLDKTFAEFSIQSGIVKATNEMSEIAIQQHKKDKEKIMNDLEASIMIKLLDFDTQKEEFDELMALFNELIDPNNEQHVKKRDELQSFIDTRFSKKE